MLDAGELPDAVSAEYAQWVERVRATFEAVQYTCAHRLRDPRLAEQVSVQVVAGLVSRPTVFRYWGLPYSGRIARLAETRIAEADSGELAAVCGWQELRRRLDEVPREHRQVLVAACVQGRDIGALALELDCDEQTAADRRAATLAFMHQLASPGLPPAPDPDEKG